jgi:hypothetical protein
MLAHYKILDDDGMLPKFHGVSTLLRRKKKKEEEEGEEEEGKY